MDRRFALDDLCAIARELIGDPTVTLSPQMSASDVPGWDSLNHTLITFAIAKATGVSLEAEETARAETFAALVAMVNERARMTTGDACRAAGGGQ